MAKQNPNQPNQKDFPPKTKIQRASKGGVPGPWIITEPGKAPYEWIPGAKAQKTIPAQPGPSTQAGPSEKAVGKEEVAPAKPPRTKKPYSKTKEFFKVALKSGLAPAFTALATGGLNEKKGEIPRGAIPSERSPGNAWFRNYIEAPIARIVGMNIETDPGWKLDPNADPVEAIENAPENVKKAYDDLIDRVSERFEDLTAKIPGVSEKDLEQFIPYIMPTPEEIDSYAPQLQHVDFGPIENEARRQFHQETIPKLAEQFAGAGGANTGALTGQLGRAGSDLESKLASLKSQYNLEQNQQQLKSHELASRRAGIMGQLGLTSGAQQLDKLRALSGIKGQNANQQLAERHQLQSLLGMATNRNTTLEPNPAQQQMRAFNENMIPDPLKMMELAGHAAKIGMMF